jgi:hypothetical protein
MSAALQRTKHAACPRPRGDRSGCGTRTQGRGWQHARSRAGAAGFAATIRHKRDGRTRSTHSLGPTVRAGRWQGRWQLSDDRAARHGEESRQPAWRPGAGGDRAPGRAVPRGSDAGRGSSGAFA